MARRWSAGRAMRSTRVGMATTTAMKPSPSKKRPTSRVSTLGAKAPSPLATTESAVPSRIRRRWPKRSALSAIAMPPSAVIRLTIDSSQPACSRLAPSSSRIDGMEGGTLPTWNAATMPAATSRPTSPQGVRDARFGPSSMFPPQMPLAYKAGHQTGERQRCPSNSTFQARWPWSPAPRRVWASTLRARLPRPVRRSRSPPVAPTASRLYRRNCRRRGARPPRSSST